MVAASVAVVTLRNPVRATLLLILSFLPTSLVYLQLRASFVGVLQILVYAGAIMMLFTFVIMMINPNPGEGETAEKTPFSLRSTLMALAVLVGAGLAVVPVIRMAAAGVGPGQPLKEDFGTLKSIGAMLFTDSAENPLTLSFELISFLILVGIIAALNFSRRRTEAAKAALGQAKALPQDTNA
jgi:NADH-quinone oxidoreductase subunit J